MRSRMASLGIAIHCFLWKGQPARGARALRSNVSGINNTASGANALHDNTHGDDNTASGVSALFHNTTGTGNTASGLVALFSNTTGSSNTAAGAGALANNRTGSLTLPPASAGVPPPTAVASLLSPGHSLAVHRDDESTGRSPTGMVSDAARRRTP